MLEFTKFAREMSNKNQNRLTFYSRQLHNKYWIERPTKISAQIEI